MRNVVLVTVDSLRADHCGFMGYDRNTTPTLDRMATDGLVFENAIAPGPSTYDSMPSIFTGRPMTTYSTSEREVGDALNTRTRSIQANMRHETIPEWFEQQGYTTGAFTTNPYTGTYTSFARGFNYFEDFMGEGEGPVMRKAAHLPVLSELKHAVTLLRGDRASKSWTDYYERIVDWVNQASEPYFLWLFLLDTHTPYLIGADYRSEVSRSAMYYHNWKLWMEKKWRRSDGAVGLDRDALVALYDGTIRSVDDFFGQLRADISRTDPAIVVHADHGEAFGEHGIYGHRSHLYEENIHVPLIVANAGEQGRDGGPISLTALPSLLRSVAKRRTVSEAIRHPVALSRASSGRTFAVRGATWKYIRRPAVSGRSVDAEELYDLSEDRNERHDVTENYPEVAMVGRQLVHRRCQHENEADRINESVATVLESA